MKNFLLLALFLAMPLESATHHDDGVNEQWDLCTDPCGVNTYAQTGQAWTGLIFARVDSFDDDRGLFNRQSPNDRLLVVRTDQTQGDIEVRAGFDGCTATNVSIENQGNLTTGKWYLVAVANDGADTATSITLWVVDLDGVFLTDGATGDATPSTECTSTDSVITYCGSGFGSLNDEMDGDCAYAAYVSQELTRAQVLQYLYNPRQAYSIFKTSDTDDHFLPLFDVGASTQPDWSGNGWDGTAVGSPTDAPNPPVGSN